MLTFWASIFLFVSGFLHPAKLYKSVRDLIFAEEGSGSMSSFFFFFVGVSQIFRKIDIRPEFFGQLDFSRLHIGSYFLFQFKRQVFCCVALGCVLGFEF